MDRYHYYAIALLWVARIVALLSLFYPLGLYMAATLLVVAEIFGLLYRFIRTLEEGGKEG